MRIDEGLTEAVRPSGAAIPAPETAEPARLFGPADASFLRDETLAAIFGESVRRHPEAVALRTGRATWTYREVDTAATAIARGLLRAGMRPGHVAGLWMARGPDLLIAQIAIAKTGAAWLPFDADAPVDRIATCLGDAEAVLLVTDDALRAKAGQAMPCPVAVAA